MGGLGGESRGFLRLAQLTADPRWTAESIWSAAGAREVQRGRAGVIRGQNLSPKSPAGPSGEGAPLPGPRGFQPARQHRTVSASEMNLPPFPFAAFPHPYARTQSPFCRNVWCWRNHKFCMSSPPPPLPSSPSSALPHSWNLTFSHCFCFKQ